MEPRDEANAVQTADNNSDNNNNDEEAAAAAPVPEPAVTPKGRKPLGGRAIPLIIAAAAVLAFIIFALVRDIKTSDGDVTSAPATAVQAPDITADTVFTEAFSQEDASPAAEPGAIPGGNIIKVLCSGTAGDSLTASADSRERNSELSNNYGITFEETEVQDIRTALSADVLAGLGSFDLILCPASPDGALLVSGGFLEDVTGRGIGIGTASDGINPRLTAGASFGNGIYLIFCDALAGDIYATSALRLTASGKAEADDVIADALGGGLTAEYFLAAMKEGRFYFEHPAERRGFLDLAYGFGAVIFSRGADGIPVPDTDSAGFAAAYDAVLSLLSQSAGDSGTDMGRVCISSLTENAGGVFLPLPKPEHSAGYVCPVNPKKCDALAVPAGVSSGNRVSSVIKALCNSSSVNVRTAAAERIASAGTGDEMTALILRSAYLDPSDVFGWGEFGELTAQKLSAGADINSLYNDSTYKDRCKTAAAAVQIVRERLKK